MQTGKKDMILQAVRTALAMHKTTRVVLDEATESVYITALEGYEPDVLATGLKYARLYSENETQVTPKGIARWCEKAKRDLEMRYQNECREPVAGYLVEEGLSEISAKIDARMASDKIDRPTAARRVFEDGMAAVQAREMPHGR